MKKTLDIEAGLQAWDAARNKGLCPVCGKVPGKLRDLLSAKEYRISGLCQDCQDYYFHEREKTYHE